MTELEAFEQFYTSYTTGEHSHPFYNFIIKEGAKTWVEYQVYHSEELASVFRFSKITGRLIHTGIIFY